MKVRNSNSFFAWGIGLVGMQGGKEKRTSCISNTASKSRTQLTQQTAKSIGGVSCSAGKQTNAANGPGGFTVAELMMATSIFTVILLVGVAGFVALSRSYLKGYTVTQTKEVAQNILNNVSANVRLSSNVSSLGTASGNRYYYCVGGNRYTFQLFKQIDTSNHDTSSKFGLLADQPVGGGCGDPYDSPGAVPLNNPTELLGNHMRLLAFSIAPAGSGNTTYSVKVTVASGSDDVLSDPNSPNAYCKGTTQTAQFCAVTTLSTIVYEGLSV